MPTETTFIDSSTIYHWFTLGLSVDQIARAFEKESSWVESMLREEYAKKAMPNTTNDYRISFENVNDSWKVKKPKKKKRKKK